DLTAVLPTGTGLPVDYSKHFHGSDLVRIRHRDSTASIFGGTDWHNPRTDSAGRPTTIREISSGLATNPTFFKFRKGAAILDSVRMSPNFFSTGHFRSNGVRRHRAGWRLTDTVKVPYHLPLPQRYRRSDGVYRRGSEGRYYSEMDFPHRPNQYRVLQTMITIRERDGGGFDLDFEVDGPDTSLTIELCFRSGGSLDGVVEVDGEDDHQLVDGTGRYTVGDDSITFGPGNGSGIGQPISMDPGEKYSYLGGNLIPEGRRVYVTGLVPFRYTLQIR
ncbi:MAG TPA: hypothetical protein VIP98_23365, partial [Microlunatus sp.]